MNEIKIIMIKIFPKEIQKLIWKSLFDDVLQNDLKVKTKHLFNVYENWYWFRGLPVEEGYVVKKMEKLVYYDLICCDDKTWLLILGAGRYKVSNAEAILNYYWS